MVKVYFEMHSGAAELVAVFADDDMYEACLPQLEAYCLKQGWDLVTESIDEGVSLETQMGD